MRVAYGKSASGRATEVRIEFGGATPNPEMLALHSRIARQMEASGGLIDRINLQFSQEKPETVGTAGWEAKFEQNKIALELQSVSQSLGDPNLSSSQKAELSYRLEELEAASQYQAERIAQSEQDGEGWVAAPARGPELAKDLGWPDAPEGHVWVAGTEQPYLRRVDANDTSKLRYDVGAEEFVEGAPGSTTLSHIQDVYARPYISAETERAVGVKPLDMKNAHLHHILEVNGQAGEHRALVREGQDILRSYDIDPLYGQENLVWAPNRGHTIEAARDLVEDLRAAFYAKDSQKGVIDILKRHGNYAADR